MDGTEAWGYEASAMGTEALRGWIGALLAIPTPSAYGEFKRDDDLL
jgi:hypothetical protein